MLIDKKGKNYYIDLEWGHNILGENSRGIAEVYLNTLVRIALIPSYHNDIYVFPPTRDMMEKIDKEEGYVLTNVAESRFFGICCNDIILYEHNERAGEVFTWEDSFCSSRDVEEFVTHKVFHCLSTKDFHRIRKELKESEKVIYQRWNRPGPVVPTYDDVKDIPVYRWLNDKILEWKPLLPQWIVERLELD